jgi:membrane protein implicated in regulation of membrane protease activity
MTIDHTISATVAVVSGAASLAIQAVTTPMVLPIVALAVTSLSMVIGGAVAYGMMKKSTMMLEKDLRHLSGQMVELIGRISTIEGELNHRGSYAHYSADGRCTVVAGTADVRGDAAAQAAQ